MDTKRALSDMLPTDIDREFAGISEEFVSNPDMTEKERLALYARRADLTRSRRNGLVRLPSIC